MSNNLLEVRDLKKYFPVGKSSLFQKETRVVKAVDGVNFSIPRCKTLGIVGESGCGKSTTGRCILRLIEPTSGSILFDGVEVTTLSKEQLRQQCKRMQIIFQDPMSSLDPRWTVKKLLMEPLQTHNKEMSAGEISDKIESLMNMVGLPPYHANKFPHEFSGGQRQRLGIARALSLDPDFIVCDEPVSALDVSIQSQVLNLMLDLQDKLHLTYMFISHDLSVVKFISDMVGVMYLGRMVEMADSDEIFTHTAHPYTQALMAALPIPDPTRTQKIETLQGEVPNPANPPSGCHFHKRCSKCMEVCKHQVPEWKEISPGHFTACHLYD